MTSKYQTALLFFRVACLATLIVASGRLHAADSQVISGELVARAYDIKDVREVFADGGVKLRISQGTTESLRAEGSASLMDRVSVDLTGQRLTLRLKSTPGRAFDFRRWMNPGHEEVTFLLQVKTLRHLETSGAVKINMNSFNVDALTIQLSGASNLDSRNLKARNLSIVQSGASGVDITHLVAPSLKVDLSGSSDFEVKSSGESQSLVIGASGASNFRGRLLKAVTAEIEASGASNVDVHVIEKISGGASGASNIKYRGQPRSSLTASGASNIRAVD